MPLATLDVILGLTFVYVVLALVCTTINELLAQWLNTRATTLREGIRQLLAGSTSGTGRDLATELYQHPLIRGLSQARTGVFGGEKREASYIPSGQFATALLDIIAPTDAAGPKTLQQIRASAADLPDAIAKPVMMFIDDANGDIKQARLNLERWYEDAMERVSGLYKRKAQAAIIAISIVLTFAINADTIAITNRLSTDSSVRVAVVAYAQTYAQAHAELANRPQIDPANRTQPQQAGTANSPVTGSATPVGETNATKASQDVVAQTQVALGTMKSAVDTLGALGIPLGWTQAELPAWRGNGVNSFWWWVKKFIGLLTTAFAISLGAPFWFDMLNKVVNIRAAGRAPEEKPKSPEALPQPRGA